MNSALYSGEIRHRRFGEKHNRFSYQVFMAYIDLAELDEVFSGSFLWSTRKPALAWLRRKDYLAGDACLDTAVRDRVAQSCGTRPQGPIRMLANLRYFGYIINPITCYYCFSSNGQGLEYIVLEVTNTPWGEKTSYVLKSDPNSATQRIHFDKNMHVSPFMPMDMTYRWKSNTPDGGIAVHLENLAQGEKIFDATLHLKKQEITPARLRLTLLRYPLMTLKVCAAIYWQAARLFFVKKIPFITHPGKATTGADHEFH